MEQNCHKNDTTLAVATYAAISPCKSGQFARENGQYMISIRLYDTRGNLIHDRNMAFDASWKVLCPEITLNRWILSSQPAGTGGVQIGIHQQTHLGFVNYQVNFSAVHR